MIIQPANNMIYFRQKGVINDDDNTRISETIRNGRGVQGVSLQEKVAERIRLPEVRTYRTLQHKSRNRYQCKACGHQTTVTAGTVMEKTRTPLTKWFAGMYLVSEDKRGLSAMALQKRIGVAYFTAWTMLQKIRFAMGNRDERYMLDGIVERDEGFFGGTAEGSKRGRGTEKAAVLVSVSLSELGKPLFARMKTLESVDGEAVTAFSKEHVKPGSEIRTDGLNIYNLNPSINYHYKQKTRNSLRLAIRRA
jgi:transposase-like protein